MKNIDDAVIGKYCIVRGAQFGVFAGLVDTVDGTRVLLRDARRIWYWDGAASLSQLATDGVKYPGRCKFPAPVKSVLLSGVIEIIPMTEEAKACIDGVDPWKV